MIGKACKSINDTIKETISSDVASTLRIQEKINQKFPISKAVSDIFKSITSDLKKVHGHDRVPEKVIDNMIAKRFPNVSKKEKDRVKAIQLVFKIHSVLGGNETLLDIYLKEFNHSAISETMIKKNAKEAGESPVNSHNHLKLDFLSPGSLSVIYEQVFGQSKTTSAKSFSGVMGNVMVSLSTPRNMRWKEKTGALALVVKAVEAFINKVNQHITDFMGDDTRDGMAKIYENLEVMRDNADEKLKIVRIFNRVMNGWMKIEDGIIKIHASSAYVTDENDIRYKDKEKFYKYDTNNKRWLYTKTNDPIKIFKDLMTLEDYIAGKSIKNKEDKDAFKAGVKLNPEIKYILQAKELILEKGLTKDEISQIVELVGEARKIHHKVFKDITSKFDSLEGSFQNEIGLWISGMENKTRRKYIIDAFITGNFNKKDKNGNYLVKDKDRQRGKFLYDNFGKSTVLNPYFTGTINLQENPNSFPVIHQEEKLRFHYDSIAVELDGKIEDTKEAIEKSSPTEARILREKLESLETNRLRIEITRRRLDEAMDDPVWGRRLYSSRDAKNLRHITQAIDIREMRDDKSVYYDYLRNMYSTLERGELARKVITAIRVADPTMKGKNKLVRDYIMGLYDTTLHKPEARANVFGVDLSLNRIYKGFIKKLPFEVDEYKLDRYARTISAAITARYLGRISTAILNKTATVQKVIHVGWHRYAMAKEKINNPALEAGIKALVQRSGILDFGDFFSKGLVQDLSQRDNISLEEALKITKLMLQYHLDVKNGMSKENAKKKFEKVAHVRAETIPGMKKLERGIKTAKDPMLKARLRAIRERKVKKVVDRWANWAITKEFAAYPIAEMSRSDTKKIINLLGQGFEALNKAIYEGGFKETLTMSGTEKELRTHSFVIGVESAISAGIISEDFWQLSAKKKELIKGKDGETKDQAKKRLDNLKRLKEDEIKAMEAGREATRLLDFGLSNQDTGEMSRLGGGIMTKFTIWSQQRFGYDVRLFRDAYRAMKVEEGSPLANTFKELFSSFVTTNPRKLWDEKPQIARLRNFILLQGPLTLLMDLAIYGPFLGPIIRRLPFIRGIGGMKIMSGMSSDLISLTTSLPIYLIFAALGDEDEEDIQQNIFYKLRKIPFLGFGFGYASDIMFWLLGIASNVEEKETIRRAEKLVSPFIPLPPPVAHVGEEVITGFLP